jgi:hypothetical protein
MICILPGVLLSEEIIVRGVLPITIAPPAAAAVYKLIFPTPKDPAALAILKLSTL